MQQENEVCGICGYDVAVVLMQLLCSIDESRHYKISIHIDVVTVFVANDTGAQSQCDFLIHFCNAPIKNFCILSSNIASLDYSQVFTRRKSGL